MQREPSECSEHLDHDKIPSAPPLTSQYGLPIQHHDSSDIGRVRSALSVGRSRSASPRSVTDQRRNSVDAVDAVDANQLDEKLRRLGLSLPARADVASRRPAAGQRVSDHENALTPPAPRQASGFKVIRRADSSSNGAVVQLADFPNGQSVRACFWLRPFLESSR